MSKWDLKDKSKNLSDKSGDFEEKTWQQQAVSDLATLSWNKTEWKHPNSIPDPANQSRRVLRLTIQSFASTKFEFETV